MDSNSIQSTIITWWNFTWDIYIDQESSQHYWFYYQNRATLIFAKIIDELKGYLILGNHIFFFVSDVHGYGIPKVNDELLYIGNLKNDEIRMELWRKNHVLGVNRLRYSILKFLCKTKDCKLQNIYKNKLMWRLKRVGAKTIEKTMFKQR